MSPEEERKLRNHLSAFFVYFELDDEEFLKDLKKFIKDYTIPEIEKILNYERNKRKN